MIEPGTIIDGRYEVLERVGSGGMADVYLAADQLLGRKVAVKVLHRRFAEDQEFVERFRREASSAAGLSHPNVVSVFDRGEWDGTYYIAMEYLPGRTLKAIVRDRGALEPAAAIDIVVQVLRAARFAHRRGVIHRDLKPHNVILDEEGRAKVTDFGIAKAGASDMTLTGSIMGTAQYLSPEQAQGHAVSESSDLYAIGVVLYELLTGKVPFEGETAVTIALQHISRMPPAPSQVNPTVPVALDAVVMRALQKDPAARYQSADELIAALEKVRATLPKPRDEHALSGASAAAGLAAAGLASAQLGEGPRPAVRLSAPSSPWHPTAGQLAAYNAGLGQGGAGVGDGLNGDGSSEPERPGRKGRRALLLASALIPLLIAAALIALLAPAGNVAVPGLQGQTKAAALTRLRALGLRGQPSYAANSTVPAGHVVSEIPAKGTQVKLHSVVEIVISTGAGHTTVPKVVGLTEEQAENELRADGLFPKRAFKPSESLKSGLVISTDPPTGRSVTKGTSVELVISTGPVQVEVPRVVGESRGSAEESLEAVGLSVGTVFERVREGANAGTVIAQTPRSGKQVVKGTSVALVVAKRASQGPAKVVVPSVLEDGRESALATLRAAGLKPEVIPEAVTSASRVGFVIRQDPPAGTKLRKEAVVRIYVGVEASTTTSSTTTSSTTSGTTSTSQTSTTKSTQAGP